jgi:hypothetical protein
MKTHEVLTDDQIQERGEHLFKILLEHLDNQPVIVISAIIQNLNNLILENEDTKKYKKIVLTYMLEDLYAVAINNDMEIDFLNLVKEVVATKIKNEFELQKETVH